MLAACADCTFQAEWRGYVFGMIYIVLYRFICKRWRKTAWPVCIAVHPREDLSIYGQGCQKTNDELQKGGLPVLAQMGIDHFPGLADEFHSSCPGGRARHGLGHMFQNLRKHQHPRHHRTAARLRNRSITTVIAYCHASSTLPTPIMYHVCWKVTHQRAHHVWLDGVWSDFFLRQYQRVAEADSPETCGTGSLITASWHFGFKSAGVRAHGPSQQRPEQGHHTFERGINSVDETATMQDVTDEIAKCSRTWTGEPIDQESSFSLLAPPSRIALRPTQPDEWMAHDGCNVKRPGLRKTEFLPPIDQILREFDRTKAESGRTVRKVEAGDVQFFIMAIGRPAPVNMELAKDMVGQMLTQREDELIELWQAFGLLTTPANATSAAPLKFSLTRFRETWDHICITAVTGQSTRATCWYSCRHGHCPHEYAAQHLAHIRPHRGTEMPMARIGQQALKRQTALPEDASAACERGSSEEAPLPKRAAGRGRAVAKPRLRGVRRGACKRSAASALPKGSSMHAAARSANVRSAAPKAPAAATRPVVLKRPSANKGSAAGPVSTGSSSSSTSSSSPASSWLTDALLRMPPDPTDDETRLSQIPFA